MAENETEQGNNLREEYKGIVHYHTALAICRFTIAGLLMTASGFMVTAVFKDNGPTVVGMPAAILGACLTLCVWMLELRTRLLYRQIGRRGAEIESLNWKIPDAKGFFSMQYKAEQDPGTLQLLRIIPLRSPITKRLWHSLGFDCIYLAMVIFWIVSTFLLPSRSQSRDAKGLESGQNSAVSAPAAH